MSDGEKVLLYVYDLTNGLARSLSPMLLGRQVGTKVSQLSGPVDLPSAMRSLLRSTRYTIRVWLLEASSISSGEASSAASLGKLPSVPRCGRLSSGGWDVETGDRAFKRCRSELYSAL
jgi:hypothetical protein